MKLFTKMARAFFLYFCPLVVSMFLLACENFDDDSNDLSDEGSTKFSDNQPTGGGNESTPWGNAGGYTGIWKGWDKFSPTVTDLAVMPFENNTIGLAAGSEFVAALSSDQLVSGWGDKGVVGLGGTVRSVVTLTDGNILAGGETASGTGYIALLTNSGSITKIVPTPKPVYTVVEGALGDYYGIGLGFYLVRGGTLVTSTQVSYNFSGLNINFNSSAFRSGSGIIAGGTVSNKAILVAFNLNGTLNQSFGSNGVLVLPPLTGTVYDVGFTPSGSVVAAAVDTTAVPSNGILALLNNRGQSVSYQSLQSLSTSVVSFALGAITDQGAQMLNAYYPEYKSSIFDLLLGITPAYALVAHMRILNEMRSFTGGFPIVYDNNELNERLKFAEFTTHFNDSGWLDPSGFSFPANY